MRPDEHWVVQIARNWTLIILCGGPLLLTPPFIAAAQSSCTSTLSYLRGSPHFPWPIATAFTLAGHRARAAVARERRERRECPVCREAGTPGRRACADALAECREPSARSATPGMGLHCTGPVMDSQASHSRSPADLSAPQQQRLACEALSRCGTRTQAHCAGHACGKCSQAPVFHVSCHMLTAIQIWHTCAQPFHNRHKNVSKPNTYEGAQC